MKTKFPFEHIVNHNTLEVWLKCNSSITALGLTKLVEQYYPGYKPKIASEDYFNQLSQ